MADGNRRSRKLPSAWHRPLTVEFGLRRRNDTHRQRHTLSVQNGGHWNSKIRRKRKRERKKEREKAGASRLCDLHKNVLVVALCVGIVLARAPCCCWLCCGLSVCLFSCGRLGLTRRRLRAVAFVPTLAPATYLVAISNGQVVVGHLYGFLFPSFLFFVSSSSSSSSSFSSACSSFYFFVFFFFHHRPAYNTYHLSPCSFSFTPLSC